MLAFGTHTVIYFIAYPLSLWIIIEIIIFGRLVIGSGSGMMVNFYNPRYPGGRDREYCSLWPVQAKELAIPQKPFDIVAYAYDPSYVEGIGRRITI
jgi:hypothetical protein